jgi:hypothetical protein
MQFAASGGDPYVVVGQFAAGAFAVLAAPQLDQRGGFGVLVFEFFGMGGVGGEMSTGQAPLTELPLFFGGS